MTEKVVSLSGGLVLGMAFALFLGVSTSQTMTSPLRVEYPSFAGLIGLNDLQSYRSSSSQASDTTPAVSVAPPAQEQDRGRIIRIATVTETTDPVAVAPASSDAENAAPKNWETGSFSGGESTLQQMHLQHSYIASASGNTQYASVGQIARQTNNFTSIADNGPETGQSSGDSGGQPSIIDNKPQTAGSPAIAQNDPETEEGEGEGQGEGPAVTGYSPRPPSPDSMSEGNTREHVDPSSPEWHNDFHETEEGPQGGHHPDPQGGSEFQQGHRPEVD